MPWDNKNEGPWNGGNNPWGKKDNNSSNNGWNPKNKGDDLMVDQSYSERQLFEKAYERILAEFKIILDISLEDTQKKLDKALKRNLNPQTNVPDQITKNPTTDISSEEQITDNVEDVEE